MKKVVFVSAMLVLALSTKTFAQDGETKKLGFSVGAELGLPMSDFGKSYSFGIGGSVQADYNIDEKLSVGLNVGYLSYSGKTITIPAITFGGVTLTPASSVKIPSFGVTPVLAGAKYNFTEKVFGQAQLGMSFYKGGSSFTYAPGIGVNLGPISALVKYVGWKDANSIGLRVAYNF
jgi:hypothetical protein